MPTLEERFWALVQKCRHGQTCARCCWEWQGPRNHAGYGMFTLGGQQGQIMSHVMALELTHGARVLYPVRILTVHDGTIRVTRQRHGRIFLGTHRCDNPPCVNPSHLVLGTHGDNSRDARRKGRLQGRRPSVTHDKTETARRAMPVGKRLGKEVHKARIEKDLTRQALADLLGMAFEKISAIERGDMDPRWSTVLKLAHALDLNLDLVAVETERDALVEAHHA